MGTLEKSRTGEEESETSDRKRLKPWLWPLLIASDVVFLAMVACFLVARPRSNLDFLVRFIDVHFIWIAVGIGLFVGLALVLSLSKSRKPSEELIGLAREMGWTLERKWGFPGGFGAFSLFGYGPYFRAAHRGLNLALSPIIDEDGRELGSRVTAYHARPLGVGLMIKTGPGIFMEGRMPDEFKGILSREMDLPMQGIRAWAANREKGMDLLLNRDVRENLDALRDELDCLNEEAESRLRSGASGVLINDRRASLLLSKNHRLNRNLVDAICKLSMAFTDSQVVPSIPLTTTGDRLYKAVLLSLILLVAASLVWVIIGISA